MNKKVHCENCLKVNIGNKQPEKHPYFCSWECFKEWRGY